MSSMGSSFTSAGNSYHEGKAQEALWDRNTLMTQYEGEMEEAASRLKTKQLLGKERLLYAKAGVDLSSMTGSPLLVMSDTAAKGELERERIGWKSRETQKLYHWYAHLARAGANIGASSGITSGVLQIGQTVMGGAGGASAGASSGGGGGGNGGGWGSFVNSMSNIGRIPRYGLGYTKYGGQIY